MKHLLTISELGAEGITELLDRAEQFIGSDGKARYSDELRNKTVANVFFEDSTRTRLSFQSAAQHLGAHTLDFSAERSSLAKGESLQDTVQTIAAMGPDAIVVRHRENGMPARICEWVDAPVINAGDGTHAHPTQGLLDALTIRQLRPQGFEGLHLAYVGDIAHSRVVRSSVEAMTMLGAEVTLVGPAELSVTGAQWTHPDQINVESDFDEVIPKVEIVYTIRLQKERLEAGLSLSYEDYVRDYCLTAERADRLGPGGLIMDAGPVIRNASMATELVDAPNSAVLRQVANGVPIRMAVLTALIGGAV